MALEDSKVLQIEEYKETGHEYRYREQLMVQEFSLSMVAASVIVGVISSRPNTSFAIVVQCFGLAFLSLLTLHLRNINQDRRAALRIKEAIRNELGFRPIHQNADGRRRRFISMSAPKMMVWFAACMTLGWFVWTVDQIDTFARSAALSAPTAPISK
jgi:hypothetical protein